VVVGLRALPDYVLSFGLSELLHQPTRVKFDSSVLLSHGHGMRVPFTRENAAEMARRANAAIAARKAEHARLLAQQSGDATEDASIKRVMKQIQRCDELLESCKAADFPKLTAAKERLWNLIFPKAGVMRPKVSRQPRSTSVETLSTPQ
jgi:hypothetical protein